MPMWRPFTSTVVVPSGDAAVIVPTLPGIDVGVLQELQEAGRELELLGDAADREATTDADLGERHRRRGVVVGPWDRVAVGARGRVAEHAHDGRLDRLGDDVLPLAGLLVGVRPRQVEDVGEEPLGEAVAAHHPLGEAEPVGAERDGVVVDGDQALVREALDHLRHRRARHHEAVGDAGLDDLDVVLVELVDGLAVLLERGVELRGLVVGHGHEATGRHCCRARTAGTVPPGA